MLYWSIHFTFNETKGRKIEDKTDQIISFYQGDLDKELLIFQLKVLDAMINERYTATGSMIQFLRN